MNRIHIIGIGFRPLDTLASTELLDSDVVLSNSRLLDVFQGYAEYERVKDRIIVHATVQEMLDYIEATYRNKKISLLAAGDPMFYGIGRMIVERFGKGPVVVYPDLSSIQVAFSRVRETSNNAILISFHGGPDPAKLRKLEYEIYELPKMLLKHPKIAVLTDKVNSPDIIAEEILKAGMGRDSKHSIEMHICEKLGYTDERIISGPPEKMARLTFAYPNVLIIKSAEPSSPDSDHSSNDR